MKNIILLFLLFLSVTGFSHKYYISTANLDYDAEDGKINCSLKLPAHDFEQVLETKFDKRIHVENVVDTSNVGLFINEYLNENFQIWSGGQQCVMEYIGKEVTLRDELFFYLSFWGVKEPNGIKVKNSLLCRTFTKQQNIVHYQYEDQSKSVTLVPSATEAEILID